MAAMLLASLFVVSFGQGAGLFNKHEAPRHCRLRIDYYRSRGIDDP